MPKVSPAEMKLHNDWKTAKGKAAEFVKANKLSFNDGFGPQSKTMWKKWGTPSGVDAAKKVTQIATGYRIQIDGAGFKPVLRSVIKNILTSAAKKQEA